MKPGILEIFIITVKSVSQLPLHCRYFLISASRLSLSLSGPQLHFSLEIEGAEEVGWGGDVGVLGAPTCREQMR